MISGRTLRDEFKQAIISKHICRNMLLMTLSAIKKLDEFTIDDEIIIIDYLVERGYSNEYIENVVGLVSDDMHPTIKQIKTIFNIMEDNHEYIEGCVRDRLMKGVDKKELKREDGRALKNYIYETEQVERILDAIGCEDVKSNSNRTYWNCSNNDGDNPKSIVVRNTPYLGVVDHTRIDFDNDRGDIITLVMYNLKCDYETAIKFIKTVLDGDEDAEPHLLIRAERDRKRKTVLKEQKVFPERVLGYFKPVLHESWIAEGITDKERARYSIYYFPQKQKIMIPHRRYTDGAIIGFNMRNLYYEKFGGNKYRNSIGFDKSQNIYALYENRDEIEKKRYVTVYESEKSPIKRSCVGDNTGLALSGRTLFDRQVDIILSLDIDEIVIALDEGLDINESRHMANKLYEKDKSKKISYIYDREGIMSAKQSPADLSNKDFIRLFENRVHFDDAERQLYLKSINKYN